MKNVNPIGREPSRGTMSAFGCVCNTTEQNNYAKVSGNVPCNVCAFSCEEGNIQNLKGNQSQSDTRMKQS